MTYSIAEQTPEISQITRQINVLVDFKYGFEISIWRSGSVSVWRTVNGHAAPLQRLSKAYSSVEAAVAAYRILRPIIAEVVAAICGEASVNGGLVEARQPLAAG